MPTLSEQFDSLASELTTSASTATQEKISALAQLVVEMIKEAKRVVDTVCILNETQTKMTSIVPPNKLAQYEALLNEKDQEIRLLHKKIASPSSLSALETHPIAQLKTKLPEHLTIIETRIKELQTICFDNQEELVAKISQASNAKTVLISETDKIRDIGKALKDDFSALGQITVSGNKGMQITPAMLIRTKILCELHMEEAEQLKQKGQQLKQEAEVLITQVLNLFGTFATQAERNDIKTGPTPSMQ